MSSSGIFLHGIALANFRGIGDDISHIGPFQRFNFMIGPNNAGKSTVLTFIAKYLKPMVASPMERDSQHRNVLSALDTRQGARSGIRMGIGIPTSTLKANLLAQRDDVSRHLHIEKIIDSILEGMRGDSALLWLERVNDQPRHGQSYLQLMKGLSLEENKRIATVQEWNLVWRFLTNQNSGSVSEHWIPETLNNIFRSAQVNLPTTNLIPAIRQISGKGQEFNDWSGAGLVDELARLQNPSFHERQRFEKFRRINEFLQSVTENASAQIEIPYDREHVLVHMDNKVLPLESLGTGIHEVVMLAAFCTLMESEIVCIEEPELHLHPLLQRRLIKYLIEKTTNQYFIATHSPSLIDTPGAAVFHVANRDGQTQISPAISSSTRFEICRDLGYRASDLLQTNAIVWVEGPSDRIYILHWIGLVAPDLIEGTDYSIMFYGGRLLSHLTADEQDIADDDIKALIAVRQLNRNLAVVIDSDRGRVDAEINATKARILDELASHGGIGWLTAGREIENYIPSQIMTKALEEAYPRRFGKRLKSGLYDHVLPFKDVDGTTFKDIDKVKVARKVCEHMNELDTLDLKEKILSLVGMIRASSVRLEQ